ESPPVDTTKGPRPAGAGRGLSYAVVGANVSVRLRYIALLASMSGSVRGVVGSALGAPPRFHSRVEGFGHRPIPSSWSYSSVSVLLEAVKPKAVPRNPKTARAIVSHSGCPASAAL